MSDFCQLSTKVSTLHCLNMDANILRDDLMRASTAKPPVLVIPCLASEFTDSSNLPVMVNILKQISNITYLKNVIIGLDQAGKAELELLQQILAQSGLKNCIVLWNDGPKCQALYKRLNQAGLDLHRPGKGKNMFLAFGMALALKAEVVGVIDADIRTFTADQVDRLLYPLVVLDYEFSKAFYARVHDGQLFGRVKRLLLDPLLLALKRKFSYVREEKFIKIVDYLLAFRYQLSGEMAFRHDLLRKMRFAMNWGTEIYSLIEIYRKSSAICQVDISPESFDHKHQEILPANGKGGLSRMAMEIIATLMNCLIVEEGLEISPTFFRDLAVTYQSVAEQQIKKYAHEASFNALEFDRSHEEWVVREVFRPALVAAGEDLQSPVRLAERFLFFINSDPRFEPLLEKGLSKLICDAAAGGQGSIYEIPQTPSWERALDKAPDILDQLCDAAIYC